MLRNVEEISLLTLPGYITAILVILVLVLVVNLVTGPLASYISPDHNR